MLKRVLTFRPIFLIFERQEQLKDDEVRTSVWLSEEPIVAEHDKEDICKWFVSYLLNIANSNRFDATHSVRIACLFI